MHHGNNHDHRSVSLLVQSTGALWYMIMTRPIDDTASKMVKSGPLFKGSSYFASRGKIAPCYFAIWRQNSPNGYFAANAKLALSLMLTQTLTLILTLALTLTQTLTQTKEKHYFASRGKIATFRHEKGLYCRN